MAPTVDFKLVADKSVSGITIVHSLNEDAFNFIVDELYYGFLPNGDVAMSSEDVNFFLDEAEANDFVAEIV